MLGVELGEALAVVDGLANDEHRGESQLVIMDNLRQILEFASIDLLVWPSQVIAGGNGRILWVLLKELALHIVDDRSTEEDAHRALTLRQQMQLFFLRHRGSTFATSQDNRLTTLRNRELALQLGCCSEEGGDAWGDMVLHVVGVEEGHLLLNGAKDTRIACMEAHDELALVVELFHQFALLFECHIS